MWPETIALRETLSNGSVGRRARPGGGALAPTDHEVGGMQEDFDLRRDEPGEVVGGHGGHGVAREERQELRRQTQYPGRPRARRRDPARPQCCLHLRDMSATIQSTEPKATIDR
jgi:hypothetical protein